MCELESQISWAHIYREDNSGPYLVQLHLKGVSFWKVFSHIKLEDRSKKIQKCWMVLDIYIHA